MATNGGRTSGIASTRRRWYEKMPSTVSATITIVANTGWLIATRVIHMARGPSNDENAPPFQACLARVRRVVLDGARARLDLQAGRLAVLQVVELGGDDVVVGR